MNKSKVVADVIRDGKQYTQRLFPNIEKAKIFAYYKLIEDNSSVIYISDMRTEKILDIIHA